MGITHRKPAAGKINSTAHGTLEDGRTLFFQTAEGPPDKDEIAVHARRHLRRVRQWRFRRNTLTV
jgi:hypothetical protein